MNILDIGFPISFFTVIFGILIGIGITTVCFGAISLLTTITMISIGMIRILPLITFTNSILSAIFPKSIDIISANIRDTFVVKGDIPDSSKQYIYMWHPHGVFSTSQFFHIRTNMTNWKKGRCVKVVALSYLWLLPFVKEVFETLNAVPSTFFEMKQVLEEGMSLSLTPGGMRELLYIKSGEITTLLSRRRGIFKMALETGTPLVPIISYGEDELYSQINLPQIKFIQTYLSKYGMCIPLPSLTSLYNWTKLLHTPLTQITSYVGAPLEVKKQEATVEAIKELREEYCKCLQELYKKTKPDGYANTLKII